MIINTSERIAVYERVFDSVFLFSYGGTHY